MSRIYLDIETIPSQQLDARALVRANLKPPGTLKKAESIAAWWQNEADSAAEEAYRRQALDALAGEVVSIAAMTDDERRWVRCRKQGESEAELLRQFFAVVEGWSREDAAKLPGNSSSGWPCDDWFIVAHNAMFDIGFLWRRARVVGVPIPEWLPSPLARPNAYGCTMALWAGLGGRVSLDSLCRALNVPSPKADGMDGSAVFDAWNANAYAVIEEYNARDAQAVAQVWDRLQGGAV